MEKLSEEKSSLGRLLCQLDLQNIAMPPLQLYPHAIRITLLKRKFAYLILWRNITHLGLELNLHCVMISSFWRHPCQLDLSQRYHATCPKSSANDWDLVPRLKCDLFGQNWLCILGVWLPS